MTYNPKFYERLAEIARMDNEVRNFNNEDLVMDWLMVGCPDESSLDDYIWFAENEYEYLGLVQLYNELYAEEHRD